VGSQASWSIYPTGCKDSPHPYSGRATTFHLPSFHLPYSLGEFLAVSSVARVSILLIRQEGGIAEPQGTVAPILH
jgi:hypothetical protein